MAETISMVITKKCIFVLGLFTLVFDVPQRKLIVTHVDNRVISHVCVVWKRRWLLKVRFFHILPMGLSTPECLRPSAVTVIVDNIPVDTIVYSNSSVCYNNSAFCLRLGRSSEGPPSMTCTSLSAKVNGSTRADLVVAGQRYIRNSPLEQCWSAVDQRRWILRGGMWCLWVCYRRHIKSGWSPSRLYVSNVITKRMSLPGHRKRGHVDHRSGSKMGALSPWSNLHFDYRSKIVVFV